MRVDAIRAYGKASGYRHDAAIARAAGIDTGGFHRLMHGQSIPSARTIAGLLATFPTCRFEDLFEVAEDSRGDGEAKAAA